MSEGATTPVDVAAKLEEQAVEDLAGKRALAEALPGPLKDAFALAPDIQCGPYAVRRFRDGDFRILAALKHPFNEFLRATMLGDVTGGGVKLEVAGDDCLVLAYVFTEEPRKIKDMLAQPTGAKEVLEAAQDKFEELRLAGRAELMNAIIQQAGVYATANIGYGQDEKGPDGESRPNPPSSAVP